MADQVELLNQQYGIDGHLRFESGRSGLLFANVQNQDATATIALQGGQIIAFQPHGQAPVLWVSQHSRYESGRAIRGGIPICWPWFGPHPSASSKPAHGFVRVLQWSVIGTGATHAGATQMRLGLTHDAATRSLWPHAFRLELVITVESALRVDLRIENTDHDSWSCTGALHSYFTVGDASRIAIDGLDGAAYLDKVDSNARKTQAGAITIAGETDRVYLDTTAGCVIDDPVLQRRIEINKDGSRTTVVWNPWLEKARQMNDFGDDEYTQMVCVETANAAGDIVQLAPGAAHTIGATVRVEPR